MPLNLQLIAGGEFIRARPPGQLDLGRSRGLMLELAPWESVRETNDVLTNLRRVDTHLSVTDLYQLVSESARSKKGRHKRIAILVQPEGFEHASFLELTGQIQRFDLEAFEHCGDAPDWLIGEDEG